MKSLLRLLTLVGFVLALFTFATPVRRASARIPCVLINNYLNAKQTIGPYAFNEGDVLVDYYNGTVMDTFVVPFSGDWYYQAVFGAGNYVSLDESNSNCTGFDPGDNRADPRPGDHLAVYCGQTTIKAIVIDPSGIGVGSVTFNPLDVLKAGKAGLTAKLSGYGNNWNTKANLGTISIQMVDSNGRTYFYVAWNGGIYQPTGQGDYTKQFSGPSETCPYFYQ